ncbi:uncharacterized protein LOC127950733 isoform X3 [Carassius gibelio]|uniref:uncharacterized protein LOC127950733 isoform X3 n=1 Tax=Carassius gibelio TaxID=101364 RepID=UPI002278EF08|nr:uncharacterized protein LOC127950733 isoform X3 [Carassius gibelio]
MSTTHPGGQVGYIGRNCTADDTQDNSWSNVAVNRQAEQQVWGEVMTGLHFTGCHIPACSLLSSRVHRLKDDKLTAHHTGYQASNDILRVLCDRSSGGMLPHQHKSNNGPKYNGAGRYQFPRQQL